MIVKNEAHVIAAALARHSAPPHTCSCQTILKRSRTRPRRCARRNWKSGARPRFWQGCYSFDDSWTRRMVIRRHDFPLLLCPTNMRRAPPDETTARGCAACAMNTPCCSLPLIGSSSRALFFSGALLLVCYYYSNSVDFC